MREEKSFSLFSLGLRCSALEVYAGLRVFIRGSQKPKTKKKGEEKEKEKTPLTPSDESALCTRECTQPPSTSLPAAPHTRE
jgi:hypothetical protein